MSRSWPERGYDWAATMLPVAPEPGTRYADPGVLDAVAALRGSYAQLIKCLFNPFRPVTFLPAWLTPTAVGIAERMYADRYFGAMPILADALRDAGCEIADVLAHCRDDGPHARGCWVVDGVLGKT